MSAHRFTIRRPLHVALVRAFHALVFVGTSIYCLLIYSPFTFQQFIKPQVSAQLAGLAAWHSGLYWLAVGLATLTIAPYLDRPRARAAGWLYLAGTSAFGVWLMLHPVLTQPDPARPNLLYALIALLPPMALGIVDHLAIAAPPFDPARDRRTAAACWTAAVLVWLTFAGAAFVRVRLGAGIDLSAGQLLLGAMVSAVAHLAAFAFLWIGLMAASGAASVSRDPGRIEYVLLGALSAAAITIASMRLVLGPIAVAGAAGWMVSAGAGVALTIAWSGVARHRTAGAPPRPAGTALDAWLAPLTVSRSPVWCVTATAVALLLGHLLVVRVSTFDWDFVIQKLTALWLWGIVFAFMYAMRREPRSRRPIWIAPSIVLALFAIEFNVLPRLSASAAGSPAAPEFALDTYAAVDPSYRLIRDAMRPGNSDEAVAFYAYLRANTGLHDARVEPPDTDFSAGTGSGRADRRPHIFLFVVDSLRADYLSPLNGAVAFTPAIASFAADSFTYKRAFTRYGGTGLAVPSIWAGGMLFHKEYVMPFRPMNTLDRLLEAASYQKYVAADHITDQLWDPTFEIARTVSEMQHSFCGTVDELIGAMQARPTDRDRPMFGHMRTLDLHIGNIWNARVPAGESYPGFFGPYAARVRAIDACFGRFVSFLKAGGLYDRSVIILTSDHGDSLGEEGRWGHGFTVFPEVMRIPLIVHVPAALLDGLETDLTRVAFNTDITPTLYALLGEPVRDLGPQFGSPLFFPAGSDTSARKRESFLVASSYGPTWGLIQDNGRSMYIADATYGRDYAYDLREGTAGRRIAVSDADRAANRKRIRDEVAAIAARYHFTPQP